MATYLRTSCFCKVTGQFTNIIKLNYSTTVGASNKNDLDEDDEMKIRDISRMGKGKKILMKEHLAMPRLIYEYQLGDKYQRRLYAKFGRQSIIDPSICWPTRDELKKIIEEDRVFEPPLQESLQNVRRKRDEEAAQFEARQQKIKYNMENLGKWMNELQQRKDRKEAEVRNAKLKKEKLIEEVREYFGYRLSPVDPKFQEVLMKKEKEVKKAVKEAKKQDKLQKQMNQLVEASKIEPS